MRSSFLASRIGALVAAHLLLVLAVSPIKGAEHLPMVLLQTGLGFLSFLALALALVTHPAPPRTLPRWQTFIGAVLVLSTASFVLFGSTCYGENREMLLPFRFASLPLVCIYFLPNQPPARSMLRPIYQHRRAVFGLLCVLAVALRVMALKVSPEPTIDVFWFTNQGATGLLQGINPYDRTFHMIDPRSVSLYAYLPGQFLLDVPAAHLLGDMRWGQVAAELCAAVVLFFIVRGKDRKDFRTHSAELMVLLLLFFPHALRVQEQAWVEFKQVLAVALLAWVWLRTPGGTAGGVLLGWLFALKQTTWAAIPFLAKLPGMGVRVFAVAAVTAGTLIVPFLIWNPSAFLEDVVGYHLALPLPHSPSLSWAWTLATGMEPSIFWVAAGAALVGAWAWSRSTRSLSGFLLASATLGMYLVLARQAYLNYYYYIDGMILVALAVELRDSHDCASGHTVDSGRGRS